MLVVCVVVRVVDVCVRSFVIELSYLDFGLGHRVLGVPLLVFGVWHLFVELRCSTSDLWLFVFCNRPLIFRSPLCIHQSSVFGLLYSVIGLWSIVFCLRVSF